MIEIADEIDRVLVEDLPVIRAKGLVTKGQIVGNAADIETVVELEIWAVKIRAEYVIVIALDR